MKTIIKSLVFLCFVFNTIQIKAQTISGVNWGTSIDSDADGYARLRNLRLVVSNTGTYVVRVYWKLISESNYSTNYFTPPVTTSGDIWIAVGAESTTGYIPHGAYDIRVVLYNSSGSTILDTEDHTTTSLLANVLFENLDDDTPLEYSISNIEWHMHMDDDADGYNSFRRLFFQVLMNKTGSKSVYTKVSYKSSSQSIYSVYDQSSVHSIDEPVTGDNIFYFDIGGASNDELPHDRYDFLIEVFESGSSTVKAIADQSIGILDNQKFETGEEDTPQPATYSIKDISWSNEIDNDGDGYTSSRRLNFDVDRSEGSAGVIVYFYRKLSNSSSYSMLGSQDLTITGTTTSDKDYFDIDNITAQGTYDFKIEVYEDGSPGDLKTYADESISALNNENFESQGEDVFLPDLSITNASNTPSVVSPGEEVLINCSVTNNSSTPVNSNFNVSYWLSEDDNFDDGIDTWLGTDEVTGLAANSTIDLNKPITIDNQTPIGNYYILIIADSEMEVDEGINEDNNSYSISMLISNSNPIITILGNPSGAIIKNYLGVDIKIFNFELTDENNEVYTFYLPCFASEDDEPLVSNLITNHDLLEYIYNKISFETYAIGSIDDILPEIDEIYDYYHFNDWWQNIPVVGTALEFSPLNKSASDRQFLGAVCLGFAEGAGISWATHNPVPFFLDGISSIANQLSVNGFTEDEIKFVLTAESIYKGDLTYFKSLKALSEINENSINNLESVANYIYYLDDLNELGTILQDATLYLGIGNHSAYLTRMGLFETGVINAFKGLAIEITVDILKDAIGLPELSDEVKVYSWLHDIHYEAIAVVAKDLLKIDQEILELETGDVSNALKLSTLYKDFTLKYNVLLRNLISELGIVNVSRLSYIYGNFPPAITGLLFGSWRQREELLDEQRDMLEWNLGESQDGMNEWISYLTNWRFNLNSYEYLIELLKDEETNSKLSIGLVNNTDKLIVSETNEINIRLINRYLSTVNISRIEVGSNVTEIPDFVINNPIYIESNRELVKSLNISVLNNYFTNHNSDQFENNDNILHSADLDITVYWSVGTHQYNKTYSINIPIASNGKIALFNFDQYIKRPGETVSIEVVYENTSTNVLGLGLFLLKPNGEAASVEIGLNPQDNAFTVEETINSNGPYGAWGVKGFIMEIMGEVIVPNTYLTKAFYVVPNIDGDISTLDYNNISIIYPEADLEVAQDIQNALGIASDHLFKVEDYNISGLLDIANNSDVILIGGHLANPLTEILTTTELIHEGDAIIELFDEAFNMNKAIVIAGWNIRDTEIAAMGFIDSYYKIININLPPYVNNLIINPNDPTINDQLLLSYYYSDPNEDSESGTQIRWYQNGQSVTALNDLVEVPKLYLHSGDSWYATVTPSDGSLYGETRQSNTVVVGLANQPPYVTNILVSPSAPYESDDLVLTYQFNDPDGDMETGTIIQWFRNNIHQPALDNQLIISNALTSTGDNWYADVKPSDGSTYGDVVNSYVVTIGGNLPSDNISDIDGNLYDIVQIGNQWWMADNLNTTRLNDGTAIPLVNDDAEWTGLISPGRCWYGNDEASYRAIYGTLYNFFTIETEKLCPTGWHVPTRDEWITLRDYLGGATVAGGKLKEAGTEHWTSPNTAATNETGFTALPGGTRYGDGSFNGITRFGTWWSLLEDVTYNPYRWAISYSDGYLDNSSYGRNTGASVRCIRDAEPQQAPSVTDVILTPGEPSETDDLILTYQFSDPNNDTESGTIIQWYNNSVHQPALDGLLTVANNLINAGESWYVIVIPSDGELFGEPVTSNSVTISSSGSQIPCFEDEFANLDNWILYGDPLPFIDNAFGNPAPGFDNNGDENYASGAISKQSFDYANGLTIESDMYVSSGGCWSEGQLSITSETLNGPDIQPQSSAFLQYRFNDDCYSGDHEGRIIGYIKCEDGQVESFDLTGISDYLDGWHRYRICIQPDLYVTFYIDNNLIYTTNKKISLVFNNMPIMIGVRSYQPVFHDNVKVYCGAPPIPPVLQITSPINNSKVNESNLVVEGTTSDEDGTVTDVQVNLNSTEWVSVTGELANWTHTVTLAEGENIIQARALDDEGYVSEISAVSVTYTPPLVTVLLEDDFESMDNWIPFGSPLPVISSGNGNPSPSFNNNGDANYNSGAISVQTFDNYEGLIIEADMYVPSNPDGCWMEGMFGIAKSTNYGSTTWPGSIIHYEYRYSGSLCWTDPDPKNEGYLIISVLTDDGTSESYELFQLNQYLDSWHRYKIVINEDRTVSFYIDDQHYFTTSRSLTSDYPNMPLLLGSRSYNYGKVYHDNIKVSKVIGQNINDQTITLNQGWNLFSLAVQPSNTNMQSVVQPLIDAGTLLKVQDELGKAIENVVPIGMVNGIGDWSHTEGYKLKVSEATQLTVTGIPVPLPANIDLSTGWNIFGYPVLTEQNAEAALSTLVSNGTLIKVQDEEGSAIENVFPIGWIYNITSLQPGEGYKIKVSADDVLILDESGTSKSTSGFSTAEKPLPSHFKPVWTGYGLDHMNIYLIEADANGRSLEPDDEIGIFDGSRCVGAGVIGNDDGKYISIAVSVDDPTTAVTDGYVIGNTITYKLWRAGDNREFTLPGVVYLPGYTDVFEAMGTTVASLNLENKDLNSCTTSLGDNYPNPFYDETTLEFTLGEASTVDISLYSLLGDKVITLVHQTMESGTWKTVWDATDKAGTRVPPGIYICKMVAGNYVSVKSMEVIR